LRRDKIKEKFFFEFLKIYIDSLRSELIRKIAGCSNWLVSDETISYFGNVQQLTACFLLLMFTPNIKSLLKIGYRKEYCCYGCSNWRFI